ncbi:hypothetical protein HAX54_045222 [Datura stramonium]|uniref:DUF4283 domain-containing protein n=1 Tax=Datura stramonium TaxID=4076 RepID=A0ABS8RJF5_DATST|nr:hypothetical protein [Datura stramonium]
MRYTDGSSKKERSRMKENLDNTKTEVRLVTPEDGQRKPLAPLQLIQWMSGRGSAIMVLQGIPSGSRLPFFIQETETPPYLEGIVPMTTRKLTFSASSSEVKPTMMDVVSENRSQREGIQLQYFAPVLKDGVKIYLHDEGHYIFQFECDKDKAMVLSKGSFTFNYRVMILKQWEPNFKISSEPLQSIPVWMSQAFSDTLVIEDSSGDLMNQEWHSKARETKDGKDVREQAMNNESLVHVEGNVDNSVETGLTDMVVERQGTIPKTTRKQTMIIDTGQFAQDVDSVKRILKQNKFNALKKVSEKINGSVKEGRQPHPQPP